MVLVNLSQQLTGQAVLVGELLKRDPAALVDPAQCAAFVARTVPLFPGELSIFDVHGRLLASSDPPEPAEDGDFLDMPGLGVATGGEEYTRVRYSRDARGPRSSRCSCRSSETTGAQVAIVRITDHLSTAQERFSRLRILIASVLAVGMLVGRGPRPDPGAHGRAPAEPPDARRRVVRPQRCAPLNVDSERGPEEVRVLARAFQGMVERIHRLEEQPALPAVQHRPRARPAAGRHARRPAGRCSTARARTPSCAATCSRGSTARSAGWRGCSTSWRGCATWPPGARRSATAGRRARPSGWASCWRRGARRRWPPGCRWTADIPPDLPAVDIDPARLGQALGNLLSNAIKYTPAPGEVRVTRHGRTRPAGSSGWPTPAPASPRASKSASSSRSTAPRPTGTIRRGSGWASPSPATWCAAHGGEVFLDSCEGAGACFTVRLPLAAPPSAALPPGETPSEGAMP